MISEHIKEHAILKTNAAASLTGIVPGAKGGTGVNNGTFTITLAGSLFTTGSFNTTFVQPQTATVTLPNAAVSTLAATNVAQIILGVQSFSNIPTFTALTRTFVYLSAAQTTAANSYNLINFDTVENGGPNFNTSTHAYTCVAPGYIRVSGAIACNTGDSGYFVVCVYKDGVVYKRGTGKVLYNPGSCNAFSMMVPVIAGTVLTIWVYTDGADQLTNADTSTWCQFEMLPN